MVLSAKVVSSSRCWRTSLRLISSPFSSNSPRRRYLTNAKRPRRTVDFYGNIGSYHFITVPYRNFSCSSVLSARGSRLRPQLTSSDLEESTHSEQIDESHVIDDEVDRIWRPMAKKQPNTTPELLEKLRQEKIDIRELVENSSKFSEAQHEKEEDTWSTSPYPETRKRIQVQGDKVPRPKIDPKQTSVVLFPGQGSQFVGMGKKLLKYPNVPELYGIASEILGYDLLKLCLEGPEENLNRTARCQTAVFVTSIAALERLQEDYPLAVETCTATAGFSVGEFAALVFAGSLTFEDALRLVKVRAEAMQDASELVKSGMMSVYVEHNSELSKAMEVAKEWCKEKKQIQTPYCQVANYLFPEAKVIAGNVEALDFIEANMKQFRLRTGKRLSVSGAFHTKLMSAAQEPFMAQLKLTKIKSPVIPVHSNVDALPHYRPPSIARYLIQQMVKPVKWEQIMHCMYERPAGQDFPQTYEVGPGRQLGTVLKRINLKAFGFYTAIQV